MTEHAAAVDVPEFYDILAPEYDGMTGFESRFVREKPFFNLIVQNQGIATALDAGCGTGFHSLLLARLGVSVTALDVSGEMLGLLERHANEMDLRVRVVRSDFRDLGSAAPGPFDAVFCMGNTLPHLLKEADMQAALAGFAEVLIPGGTLVLQLIN
jgi:glycine/sarcosine N-methyltransferase